MPAKIPISNLFYLLVYAWDLLEHAGEIEVGKVQCANLENLMAVVMISLVDRAIRRGLEQEYEEVRLDSKWICGRIDVQETTRRFLRRRGEVHIVSVELSPDTLANRIVKATLASLLATPTLTYQNRETLTGLHQALRDVASVTIGPTDFVRVRLHINNREYRTLLAICEMIASASIPNESGGGTRFVGFTRPQMWLLFQKFLFNFYRTHLKYRASVAAEQFGWFDSAPEYSAPVVLPVLQTDFVITTESERIVVEAKYYSTPFVSRRGATTLRPQHVNQLFAYMQNVQARDLRNRRTRGILLYAGTSGSFAYGWRVFGHRLTAAGVDLSQEWPHIERQLLELVGPI